ncbi:MAG: PQQ-dependent sugar dehydrogenase [Deltaproteobacteria bacterium]|nr:PQQ-dependent sugar dehydrogenase [Deltaproteobacteria bacterium]
MILVALPGCDTLAAAPPEFRLRLVEAGRVSRPTAIATPPGADLPWVTSQPGQVHSLDGKLRLDISARVKSGGETGLLGLAFHPRWPADPRAFVNYTYRDSGGLHTRVASFRLAAGGEILDPDSEVTIITYDQPWSNHNSGPVAFGADGKLYITVGDGGSGGDPLGTGQSRTDLLGSILRLDVDTVPYAVPPDNPFVGERGVRPEIWAYGVRNPWGLSLDGDTLWFADVGQDQWEEVNVGVAGANYGWNVREGRHCYGGALCEGGFTEPVAGYHHQVGTCITGGLVYRGPSIPAIDGQYVYADFGSGRFFATTREGEVTELGRSGLNPSTFGRDAAGRMYVADYGPGVVYRVE